MFEFLRDPAWGGVAAVAAILTLIIMIIDRISVRFNTFLNNAGIKFVNFIKAFVFSLYGVIYGVLGMILLGQLAKFINTFSAGNGFINGGFGIMLLELSKVKFIFWGFNSQLPILELQFGTLGLWGGSLIGFFSLLGFGGVNGFQFSALHRYHHFWGLYVVFFIVLIGLINIAESIFV